MTKLYIIGNGFDLWHGPPTGYDNFYIFTKELLDEMENYYIFDTADSDFGVILIIHLGFSNGSIFMKLITTLM